MENKIIQIWEDSTHETALYPTSVAEAIKWDSNQTIAQYIANNVGFYGIDTSRVIASGLNTYSATEDCWAIVETTGNSGGGYNTDIFLNGVMISKFGTTNSGYVWGNFLCPLKVGDIIVSRKGNSGSETDPLVNAITIYGIKGGNS